MNQHYGPNSSLLLEVNPDVQMMKNFLMSSVCSVFNYRSIINHERFLYFSAMISFKYLFYYLFLVKTLHFKLQSIYNTVFVKKSNNYWLFKIIQFVDLNYFKNSNK